MPKPDARFVIYLRPAGLRHGFSTSAPEGLAALDAIHYAAVRFQPGYAADVRPDPVRAGHGRVLLYAPPEQGGSPLCRHDLVYQIDETSNAPGVGVASC